MKYSLSPPTSRSSSVMSNSFRGSSSPLPPPTAYTASCMTAAAKRYKYLRRLFKFHQMDFEFALWQMIYLFIAPQKVYRNFYYRKQTKSQFARDDPAFLVLLTLWLLGSSVGFAFVLKLGFWHFVKFTLYVIIVDCIGVGVCVATILWHFSNKHFKKDTCMDQDVEWGYAFDVHLNAFFPLLLILHVFQLFFYHGKSRSKDVNAVVTLTKCLEETKPLRGVLPSKKKILISQDWFISTLFGNTLWLIALGYYIYITFLGYSSLPILHRTHILLYPLTLIGLTYIVSVAIGWNLSQSLMYFYTNRVLYI